MRKLFCDQSSKQQRSFASLKNTLAASHLHYKGKKNRGPDIKASVSISINEGVGQAPVGLGSSFIQPSLCNPMFRISWTTRRRFRSTMGNSH